MASETNKPLRVLFLCTHNAARSQISEALLSRRGGDRFVVASAGADPASEVHAYAIEALLRAGINWSGRRPKGLDAVLGERWDLVITVCDRAREVCPRFPGRPITAHWGIPDPAETRGDDTTRREAFWTTLVYLSRRIDLLVALPHEKLERMSLEHGVRAIGDEVRNDKE